MKKWLISFLMTALVLAGCAESPSSTSTNDTNNATKTEDVSKEQTQKEEASKTTNSTDDGSNEKTQEKTDKEESQTTQSKATTNNQETNVTNPLTASNKVSNYPTFETTVISVVDGDTFHALINNKDEKVRLILTDSPETVKRGVKIQRYGPEASAYTKSVLKPGTKVNLELDAQERDQYGRILAYVYVDGKMLNETLLEKGLARVAVFPPNTRYVDEFREIQEKAKQQKLGVWSIDGYVGEKGFNDGSQNSTNSSQSNSSQKSTSSSTNSNSNGSSNTGSNNSTTQPFQNNPADDVETNTSCQNKIKGNANSKIYHVPGGAYYDKTVDNIVWFCTEQDAQNQGYRRSQR
ncbi:thermonuclease family protein [Priestia megaterium]|uniref:thermonuclease family protein n=1 Tax=Priestia megaterium TaxID=1404 RepID=UPI0031018DFF